MPGLTSATVNSIVSAPKGYSSTPVPDEADAERMHKYMTDRRVIGVRRLSSSRPPRSFSSHLLSPTAFSSPSVIPTIPCDADLQYDPLIQPALIRHEIQSTPQAQSTIAQARWSASRIIAGEDDRVIVVVGPCSIHNPEQAIAYAKMLKEDIPKWDGLLIIMRSYLYVLSHQAHHIVKLYKILISFFYFPVRSLAQQLAGKALLTTRTLTAPFR